jgi:DHA1 family tetracycline resistance protein-like MFS transporter
VQGVFSGLMSLAGIPGPVLATWTFGWAISDDPAIHLPWFFSVFDHAVTWLAAHLLPRHPGLPFFISASLVTCALVLAVRSFQRHDPVKAA